MATKRKGRRRFTPEYKAEVVALMRKSGKTAGQVARDLDLTETSVRAWLRQAEIDEGKGPAGALTTAEREELAALKREVKTLRLERDILKNFRERSLHLLGEKLQLGYDAGGSEGAAGCFLEAVPVKKHGPRSAACLALVTPSGDPV
jgi:transposase